MEDKKDLEIAVSVKGVSARAWRDGRAAAIRAGVPWGEWLSTAILGKIAMDEAVEKAIKPVKEAIEARRAQKAKEETDGIHNSTS